MADRKKERIVAPKAGEEDLRFELSLRPTTFEEFIGQEVAKENLRIFVEAARRRKEALDHVLLCGPPGLGKTTLAYLLARALQVDIRATSGPVIERPGDLAAILTNLKDRDILFIDEIHRLSRVVEEILYPAMEDYQLDLLIGQGPSARTLKIDLPRFTLVGATTRTGLLTSPLRDRFGVFCRLDYYRADDIRRILDRSARILGVVLEPEGAEEIARRSRGTPRVANRLLRRVRDYAQVKADGVITREIARAGLELLEVDERGFDAMDRKYLRTLIEKFDGGPAGIDALAAAVSEERDTLEEVYEPFLLQEGFLDRTTRGRLATRLAYEHFGLKREGQEGLFEGRRVRSEEP